MALVTLDKYKRAIRETGTANDQLHQDALDAASEAILNYSDRDFGAPLVTEDRTWAYDGSGILNIDDANTVNSVTFQGSAALAGDTWRAKKEGPASVVVFSYLELPVIDWGSSSPQSLGEMGFLQNLDRFIAQPGGFRELTTTVNAEWGWPTVPNDVQQATIWTAYDWEQNAPTGGSGGELASESVAEVTKSYFANLQQQQGTPAPDAIPPRARAIIDAYARYTI